MTEYTQEESNKFEQEVDAETKAAYERIVNPPLHPEPMNMETALVLLLRASAYFIKHIDEMSPEARRSWALTLALYRTDVPLPVKS